MMSYIRDPTHFFFFIVSHYMRLSTPFTRYTKGYVEAMSKLRFWSTKYFNKAIIGLICMKMPRNLHKSVKNANSSHM